KGMPARETLLGRYRNELICPLIQSCVVSHEPKKHGTVPQAYSQRRRVCQPPSLGHCGVAPCQCLLRITETEKREPQKRLCVNVGVVSGLMGQRTVGNRIV